VAVITGSTLKVALPVSRASHIGDEQKVLLLDYPTFASEQDFSKPYSKKRAGSRRSFGLHCLLLHTEVKNEYNPR
jgi:hypothetical protein